MRDVVLADRRRRPRRPAARPSPRAASPQPGAKLVSQPSSLMRAVSSETLSVGAYASKSADLAEVVDGVRGVRRAAADAEDEQPPAALADRGQAVDDRVDRVDREAAGELAASSRNWRVSSLTGRSGAAYRRPRPDPAPRAFASRPRARRSDAADAVARRARRGRRRVAWRARRTCPRARAFARTPRRPARRLEHVVAHARVQRAGAIALTPISVPSSSRASVSVKRTTATFAAA